MNKETLPQIGVGETLRMARERSGQDLRHVADMLRIRYVYLEAIETGEYHKLPGATYAIGFVRAYADHLNLNSVEIVERFKQEQDDLDQQTQLVFPKPLPEGKVPSGGILLVAVVLGLMVYGAWFFLSGQDKPIVELIPEIPARLMALVGAGDEEDAVEETAIAEAAEETPVDGDTAETVEPVEPEPAPVAEQADEPMVAETAPQDAAEPASMQADTAAADDGAPAAAVAETPDTAPAEPEADVDATAMVDPASDAAAETAVSQTEALATEPADETTADETAAALPAETAEQAADASQDATPSPVTDDTPSAEVAAEDAAPPAEETPAPAETQTAAQDDATPSTPPESAAPAPVVEETAEENDSATAIAQRVLDELAADDGTPAASPSDAAETGDAAETEAAADPSPQRAEDTAVAAITPAARTPDAPAADAPSAAVQGNGTAARTASLASPPPGGKVYGDENVGSRILITARVDSWVEVSTQQGELLLTRVLRAGDSFRVPDQDGLSLVTGNAGGLAISVDGAQVPDLGPVGAVRRGVELDPDRLKAGTAGDL